MVPGGEAEQCDVVTPCLHGIELHGLVERDAIELGVVVRRAVEADHLLQKLAVLGAGDQLVGDAAVGERESDLRLVDDFAKFAGAQHRHRIDHHGAGFGRGKPGSDQRGIIAGADEHAIARLHAVVLDQRMREAVRPVGELLIGATATIADQRGVIAKTIFDQAVGQLVSGVDVVRILKFRTVEQDVGPLLERRQVVARERVDMRGWAERDLRHD